MTLNNADRNELIQYRMQQAAECIDEVSFLIANEKYKTAVNRIYYGMFYALLALALSSQFESSKHAQLLGWFNQQFIHTGIIPQKFGKMIYKAFTLRNESDYEPFVNYEEPEIADLFDKMKEFIYAIGQILLRNDTLANNI